MKSDSTKSRTRTIIIGVVLLVLVGISAAGYIFGKEYFELKSFKEERDVAKLSKQLEKHMLLPEEEPLIATVTDSEKLKQEQAFYRNAQNDDKVFIWKDKALIYRPSEDKIVDFGIILNTEGSAAKENPLTVLVLNGSGTPNGANQVRDLIQSSNLVDGDIQVSNAHGGPYQQTLVIDVTGANTALVASIAEAISGQVQTSLPQSETVTGDTEIVVITGSSQ